MNDFIDKILISQEEIQSRVKQYSISQDYVDKEIRAIGYFVVLLFLCQI